MIQYVLIDIEGTVSDINFVHKVLFPYAEKHLSAFLQKNSGDAAVQECISQIESEFSVQGLAAVTDQLKQLIEQDIKHPALKKLQGMIWKTGFESEEFKSHIYDDVLPNLKKWKEQGLRLGIYSSGSVAAQKLFFAHTEKGDLLDLFEDHFDLEVGGKKDADSYRRICEQTSVIPEKLLFLSDVDQELGAATKVGCQTTRLIRPGTPASGVFREVDSFNEIIFSF